MIVINILIALGVCAVAGLVYLGATIYSVLSAPSPYPDEYTQIGTNLPSAIETQDIIGPTPESGRANWEAKARAPFHNDLNCVFNPSGTSVGCPINYSGPYYWVKAGVVHGPYINKNSEGDYKTMFSYFDPPGWDPSTTVYGWGNSSYSDTKAGHSIKSVGAGGQICFDICQDKQSDVRYDGVSVGLYNRMGADDAVRWVLLSDDGKHYAYIVIVPNGYDVLVDGKKSVTYPYVGNLHSENSQFVFDALSPDFLSFLRVKITPS